MAHIKSSWQKPEGEQKFSSGLLLCQTSRMYLVITCNVPIGNPTMQHSTYGVGVGVGQLIVELMEV